MRRRRIIGEGGNTLKPLASKVRRRIRDITDFVQQCVHELTGRDKRQRMSNSDLRSHSFASTRIPGNDSKKKILFRLKNIFRKRKKAPVPSYLVATRERSLRKKLVPAIVLVLLTGGFFLSGGPQYFGRLFSAISIFKVQALSFAGCEATSELRLRHLTDVTLYKTSLLNLEKVKIESSVERDPWVSKAVVKRKWPSTLIIEVVEHNPVALVNVGGTDTPKLYYVDRKGNPFLEVRPGHDVDYPVITGIDLISGDGKARDAFSDIYAFLRLVGNNNPNLPAQSVSEIHVNDQGEIVVYLVDHTFPIFFGRGQIADKYKRLVRVLGALYKENRKGLFLSGVEYIRMDYLNDKVLVAQSESG